MFSEFKSGLEIFKKRIKVPRLTTGSTNLDSLLGGGIEPGYFYLFYGSKRSGVDLLIHKIMVNALLPKGKSEFWGKVIYANCGNYREEKTILDSHLLIFLIKRTGLDPKKALDNIYVICAFSEEQQEQIILEVQKLLMEDQEVRLVVVHNIAKLFVSSSGKNRKSSGERIARLQKVTLI